MSSVDLNIRPPKSPKIATTHEPNSPPGEISQSTSETRPVCHANHTSNWAWSGFPLTRVSKRSVHSLFSRHCCLTSSLPSFFTFPPPTADSVFITTMKMVSPIIFLHLTFCFVFSVFSYPFCQFRFCCLFFSFFKKISYCCLFVFFYFSFFFLICSLWFFVFWFRFCCLNFCFGL